MVGIGIARCAACGSARQLGVGGRGRGTPIALALALALALTLSVTLTLTLRLCQIDPRIALVLMFAERKRAKDSSP